MAALRPLSQHAFSASLFLGSFFVLMVVMFLDNSGLKVSAGSSLGTSKAPTAQDASGLGL
jgi:hypothetical protein